MKNENVSKKLKIWTTGPIKKKKKKKLNVVMFMFLKIPIFIVNMFKKCI